VTTIETHLKGLAVSLGQQLHAAADKAKGSLPKARERLAEIFHHRHVINSAMEGASPDSAIHDVARQVEKDVAEAMAELSSLELAQDAAEAAVERAQSYMPATHRGSYACPQCWILENITTDLDALLMASAVQQYECPTCSYAFMVDSEYHPQAALPQAQTPSI